MLAAMATEGFILHCQSTKKLKPSSIKIYQFYLTNWLTYSGNVEIENITPKQIQDYLSWLGNEYTTIQGDNLKPATVYKAWVVLKSFYAWASTDPAITGYGLGIENATAKIKAPRVQVKQVIPFDKEEIKAMLDVVKPQKQNKLASLRKRAICFLLLDVGIRNSELCNLKLKDLNLNLCRLYIAPGKTGKDRYVHFGEITQHALWQYLAERGEKKPDAWLFISGKQNKLTPRHLRNIIHAIGKKAGVENCYPHRFRHTCAFMRVQNGESAETIQHLLGHSSINMALYYVNLAKLDVAAIQRRSSPIDNL